MAFATSPYGLGITERQFWDLTPREFQAFVRVKEAHDELAAVRWAVTCSMFANANFRGREHPQAYTADDFLGRAKQNGAPKPLTPEQQAAFKKEELRLNLAMGGMYDVPEWAKATVQASKAAGAVAPANGEQKQPTTGFVFEDSPEGRAKRDEWLRSQMTQKRLDTSH